MADGLLSGKFAIITGAGRGMGRAMARAFAAAGAAGVCVTSGSSLGEIRKVADEIDDIAGRKGTGLAITADVRERAACAHAVEQAARSFGALHILVNNAGLGMKNVGASRSAFWDCDPDGWEKLMGVNVNGPFHMARAAAKHLIAAGWGRIINVISTSVKQPLPGLGVSNTIRGAVASWAKTWATEVAPMNITVNNVLPGATGTQRLSSLAEAKAEKSGTTPEAVLASMAAQVPMGRTAEPEEIARAIAFLASPSANYISGINLPVDGGRTGCL